jgi:RimJ/RimL family protein N-acetyltransferase
MRQEPRLLFGYDEDVAKWVSQRLAENGGTGFGKCTAIGIFDGSGSRIIAGCVYFDYQPNAGTIGMAIASESPMFATPGTIRALLHYPFEQIGAFKAWATTLHTNERSQRFLTRVGFVREGILRHQFGQKRHAAFYGLIKPEYLRKYGH